MDPTNAQLWRNDEKISFRRKTFDVLLYLVDHPGQLVTKASPLDALWADVTVTDSMPAICVADLRKALGDDEDPASCPTVFLFPHLARFVRCRVETMLQARTKTSIRAMALLVFVSALVSGTMATAIEQTDMRLRR